MFRKPARKAIQPPWLPTRFSQHFQILDVKLTQPIMVNAFELKHLSTIRDQHPSATLR